MPGWAKTSRHERGYGAAHVKMRAHLIATVVLCEECSRNGKVTVGTIADHIIPKAKGGGDERGNYQLLCEPCSDAKTLIESGAKPKPEGAGIARSGRPSSPDHPWNKAGR